MLHRLLDAIAARVEVRIVARTGATEETFRNGIRRRVEGDMAAKMRPMLDQAVEAYFARQQANVTMAREQQVPMVTLATLMQCVGALESGERQQSAHRLRLAFEAALAKWERDESAPRPMRGSAPW